MKIEFSLVVPCYNEEKNLEKNVMAIKNFLDSLKIKYEIIISEESSDATPEIAERLAKKFLSIRHIHSNARLGKGAGFENGVSMAKGGKIAFMDADLAVDVEALGRVIKELDKNDIVVTSRYHPDSKVKRYLRRKILSKGYMFLDQHVLGIPVRDTRCGCKGFRAAMLRELIPMIKDKRWFWDSEALFWAHKKGMRIKEIPVKWEEAKTSSVNLISNVPEMLQCVFELRKRYKKMKKTKTLPDGVK